MKSANALLIGIFLVTFSGFFPGCVTDTTSLKIEKSLPQSKLAYYNDSFDKQRTDLWDKAGYVYNKEQEANFKLADMRFEHGKLRIETKTGCFSKRGLGSKYVLRGNFDIQVDCQIDFLQGVHNMDQALGFIVVGKGKKITAGDAVLVRLLKRGGSGSGKLLSASLDNGNYHPGTWYEVDGFDGTLRIIRKGSDISILHRNRGEEAWELLDTFWSTSKDLLIGLYLQNYTSRRTSITARSSITATFDNFRINAAEEIIEEDI